jgi:very-short-patch-repair endonuclease
MTKIKHLKNRTRNLRLNQTEAEGKLWRHLRNRNLAGFKFRRQHAIGSYIADFACLEKGLLVEVDGGQHVEREEQDLVRTRFLEEQGFRVLRFWNHDVLTETEAVLEKIRVELAGCYHPHPDPLPEGERDKNSLHPG